MVRVEEKGSDFYTVADSASDAFERRIKRSVKTGTRHKHKNGLKENLSIQFPPGSKKINPQ